MTDDNKNNNKITKTIIEESDKTKNKQIKTE